MSRQHINQIPKADLMRMSREDLIRLNASIVHQVRPSAISANKLRAKQRANKEQLANDVRASIAVNNETVDYQSSNLSDAK